MRWINYTYKLRKKRIKYNLFYKLYNIKYHKIKKLTKHLNVETQTQYIFNTLIFLKNENTNSLLIYYQNASKEL